MAMRQTLERPKFEVKLYVKCEKQKQATKKKWKFEEGHFKRSFNNIVIISEKNVWITDEICSMIKMRQNSCPDTEQNIIHHPKM